MKKCVFPVALLFFATLFLSTINAANPINQYQLIPLQTFQNKIATGNFYYKKNLILVPNYIRNKKAFFTTNDSDSLMLCALYLLKKGQSQKVFNHITQMHQKTESYPLILGLYYFLINNYKQSIIHLNYYSGEKYLFLKLFLFAEASYAILPNKTDYPSLIHLYQKALDYTENESEKAFIKMRIKYLKYI